MRVAATSDGILAGAVVLLHSNLEREVLTSAKLSTAPSSTVKLLGNPPGVSTSVSIVATAVNSACEDCSIAATWCNTPLRSKAGVSTPTPDHFSKQRSARNAAAGSSSLPASALQACQQWGGGARREGGGG
jgi:hypothetical protein